MRCDVVDVTVRLGDTIVTTGQAHGPFAFDWAPDHVLAPPAERDVPVHTRIGLADVTLTRVAAPERTLPYAPATEWRAWRYLAVSLVIHLVLWGVAATKAPVPERTIDICPREYEYTVMFAAPAAPHDESDGDDTLAAANGGVVPMRLDLPAAPKAARTDDGEDVSTAGNVGTATTTADLLAALTSDKLYSISSDDGEIYGPLFGPGAESASGFGTARSFQLGGGCTEEPCGTIAVLHDEPIGKTSHVGAGWGLMAHDHSTGPTCTLHWDTVTMNGELGKEVIRRYIRDHLDQLSFCYEAQLLHRPTLEGDLALSFLIEPSGQVQGVVASGVSTEVETCVAGVIRAIEFPKTVGGGTTQVNYPLTFHITR